MERTPTDELSSRVVAPDFGHVPDGFEALTSVLSRERELLDELLFVLVSEQLMIESHNTRWLTRSSAQVSAIVAELQELELLRCMLADQVGEQLQITVDAASLDALADAAGEPTASIQRDLRVVIGRLVAEIDRTVHRNQELLIALVRPRRDESGRQS